MLAAHGAGEKVLSKYGAKRCEADGFKFASILEHDRYRELVLLQRAHAISELEVHPPYRLSVHHLPSIGEVVIGKYIADFAYLNAGGDRVVEDCKGLITQLARWKLKHFHAQYGFAVTIVRKQDKRVAAESAYKAFVAAYDAKMNKVQP